jgi:L-malate glycosyltransferase
MSQIKISYLIGSLATGGAERQLLELLARLDRSCYDASLVLFDATSASRAEGLVSQVFSLNIPATNNSRPTWHRTALFAVAIGRLIRHYAKLRPHIVHAILPAACVLAGPAAKAARVPVVIGSRRSLPVQYRADDRLPQTIEKFSMRFMDWMLGNSMAVTRTIVDDDGYPAGRASTIHNGVDTERFKPSNSRNWRNLMGWTSDTVVFGTVANFFGYKRHADAVVAVSQLRDQFPKVRFVLVGQDRGTMPAVRRQIADLNLEDVVAIVPGTSTPEDVYAAIDVYVCPSATEGLSNVLLEAMATGKPVIATAAGGNVELVRNGWNGFIVPVATPGEIANAVRTFMTSPQLIATFGSRSRELVEQEYSVARMVKDYQVLYSTLLYGNRN